MTPTATDFWSDGKRVHVVGTLLAAGNYVTNGIALDLPVALSSQVPGISAQPVHVQVQGIAGYFYEYDKANKKVLIRQQTDPAAAGGANIPFVQLAAAALPAGVTGDTISFYAIFKQLQ